MGTIYKKTNKRPTPAGAEIVTRKSRRVAIWPGKDGRKHQADASEDGKTIYAKSDHWYIAYVHADGVRRPENTRTTERDVARQILAQRERRVAKIRSGVLDPATERIEGHAASSISTHLADYRQYLADKGATVKHVAQTIKYAMRLVDHAGAEYYNRLTTEAILRALRHIQTEPVIARRGHSTRGPKTANAHLIAIKSFCRWMVRTRRSATNPADAIGRFADTDDVRQARRAMTSDEFARLYATAGSSETVVQGVDGPTRATIYLIAAMTGLRRQELASLTRADFRLDSESPTVRIQGAYSKNKRTDEIPLHPDAVKRLREYIDRTQPEPGKPIFPLRSPGGDLRKTSTMMHADLDAARAAWLNEAKDNPGELKKRTISDFLEYSSTDGFFDFHANRVLFVTSLCRGNVGLVTAQKLARHSDPKLTANIYSKINTDERAAAIDTIKFDLNQ